MFLKIFTFASMAFFTLFLIWGAGWLCFAASIALTSQPKIAEVVKTDAIIVATGGTGRIQSGLTLLNEGIAPKLFISGVNHDVTKEDILVHWNGDQSKLICCIELGYEAQDTAGNAQEIKDWVRKNDIKSINLVTSSYHIPRVYLEVARMLPDLDISLYPVVSGDFKAWEGRFWSLTLKEYNKILFIWMKSESENRN